MNSGHPALAPPASQSSWLIQLSRRYWPPSKPSRRLLAMLDTLNGTSKAKTEAMRASSQKYKEQGRASRQFVKDLPTVLNMLDKLPVSKEQALQAIRELMPDA